MDFCININSNDYKEMSSLFGEDLTYFLWNNNGGNPLDFTPTGEPSKLFKDLLDLTGSREQAMKLKAQTFSKAFKTQFADTTEVDDNGEPLLSTLGLSLPEKDAVQLDFTDVEANYNHPDVQVALDKYRPGVIHDTNNPLVWNIEEEFGITPGKNAKFRTQKGSKTPTKIINNYTHAKAVELAGEINRKYKGVSAIATKNPTNLKYYTVSISVPIGMNHFGERYTKKATFTLVGLDRPIIPEDRVKIGTYVQKLSSKTPISLLRQILKDNPEVFENNEYLKNRVEYILSVSDKFQKVRLAEYSAINKNDETFMDYSFTRNVIRINADLAKELSNIEAFIEAFTHEFFHAITSKALEQPSTEVEKQFKKDIENLFDLVIEESSDEYKYKYRYAFQGADEFMSIFMSNKEFAETFKPNTINRIKEYLINLFKVLLGIKVTSSYGPNIYNKVHNIVNEFVDKQSNFVAVDPQKYRQTDITEKKAVVKATESIEERTRKAYEGRPKEIEKAFRDIAKDFDVKKFEENHEYYHKPSGLYFTPTSKFLADAGYGISEIKHIKVDNEYVVTKGAVEYDGITYKEGQIFVGVKNNTKFKILTSDSKVAPTLLDRGAKLGTTVHKNLEFIANGILDQLYQEEGFEVTPKAKASMVKILQQRFLKKGNIVLSEVKVMDPDRKIAGTIDLIVIDKLGRVKLYDFKNKELGYNKETGKERYGFKYYERGYKDPKTGDISPSFQKKARLQLSIYKHMVDKMFKFRTVSEMGIVLLEPVVEGNKIISIDLARQYGDSGIDTFIDNDPSFQGVYGEAPMKFNKTTLMQRITGDRNKDSYMGTEEYIATMSSQAELTEMETLLSKMMKALGARMDIMQARYSLSRRQSYQEFYDNLQGASTATAAFVSIINYAHAGITQRHKEYEEFKKSGQDFKPEQLHAWKEYLIAFDQLSELQNLILDDPTVFSDPDTIKKLNEAVTLKNHLQSVYVSEGKHVIAKWLAPYYNGIKAAYREEYSKRYRKEVYEIKKAKDLSAEEKAKKISNMGTEKQYVDGLLMLDGEDIDKQTYDFIYKELTVASRDVNTVTRWLDNMLDTPDAVAGAMIKAFVHQHDKSRVQSIKKRTEFLKVLTEYEKEYPRSATMSEESLYRALLEHDEKGNPTGYLLRPWTREFEEVEREEVSKLYKEFDQEIASRNISAWRKDFMPVNQEEYYDGLEAYLEQFTKGPEATISPKEIDLIIYNLRDPSSPSLTETAEDGDISELSAELSLDWLKYNRWKYSNLKDYTDPKTKKIVKARNPEWDTFMKELGIPLDLPMYKQMDEVSKSDKASAKLYTFLLEVAKDSDSKLPYSYRLGYRLPGVAKTSFERLRDGQSPSTYFKEEFKSGLFLRPEDVERGEAKEYKDELDRPKYFLPIHYTNRIEPQNQSYDLPTIYFKFWDTSNDYVNKREILAEMEMTKFFIENRLTKQLNVFGRPKKQRTKVDDDDGDEKNRPSVTNASNLAAQFEDWFEMAVYGRKSKDSSKIKISDNLTFDVTKFIDMVNGYTSFNMLALNIAQGVANIGIGEAMQGIDAIAGEHISIKTLTKATAIYTKWLPGMLGDVGARVPQHIGTQLIERFNIMHTDIGDIDFSRKTIIGQKLKADTLFFVQEMGEHWMQNRFLFGLLYDKKAYNSDGVEIGNILEMYEKGNIEYKKLLKKKHGDKWEDHYIAELRLPKEMDLVQSKWTEADQTNFMYFTKGKLTSMHGEYSDLGRVAAQRLAVGRMAYMFRKFVVPGVRRRYGRRHFSSRMDQFIEGNYRTTGRFFMSLIKDLKMFQLSLMSEKWAELNDHERANIKRTISELGILLTTIIIGTVAYNNKLDDDEDDYMWGFLAYQAFRLKSELLFFTSPGEAMTILRSPMASMSVLENTGRLLSSLLTPGKEFERGPWKGELKLKKNFINMIPVYKQYYKARDIEEQIKWFKN